jgi:competence protein ComEC
MAGVFLLGLALGRQQSGLAALAAAAIVMTAWSPSAAQAVGFQLSLAATAGLIVFGPWIAWGLERISPVRARAMLPRGLYLVASWTLASTIATAPLLWLNFGELSTVGVIANLLVEPAFALALGLSLVTAVAGLAWEPLGWIAGTAAWYPLALMNRVAETLSSRQWASVEAGGATGTRAALAYFVLIAVGAVAFRFPPPALEDAQNGGARVMRRYSLAAVAGSLVVAVAWFSVRPAGGPGDLIITFLDVGQGDAVLITTPNGRQILVDGGASGIGVAQEIGAVMPHWDRRLDYVVLTHPQQDHMAGLVEVGRRFDVGVVIESGATNTTEAFELYTSEFRERETWRAGQATTIDGVEIAVLWPPAGRFEYELNNTSLVLRLEYGGTILLLTGDIQSEAQEAMLASGAAIDADVLKVPHHGAATSTEAFFDAVSADLAIISAGAGNRFGHPLDETIEALAPATVVRTDERGRVTVVVAEDGRVTYRTER